MNGRSISWVLSLPVFAGLLGVLTLALMLLGRYFDLGTNTFLLLAIPIALAIMYLARYSTLPHTPERRRARPRPVAPPPEEEEPFDDPVEEADRIDSEPPGAETLAEPAKDLETTAPEPTQSA